MKNILILTGSAHKTGTSLSLADEFEKGALESGNKVKRYDTAFLNVGTCKGCNYCKKNSNNCIQKDDFDLIKKKRFNRIGYSSVYHSNLLFWYVSSTENGY